MIEPTTGAETEDGRFSGNRGISTEHCNGYISSNRSSRNTDFKSEVRTRDRRSENIGKTELQTWLIELMNVGH